MIARIWHGKTPLSKYEEYTEFLKKKAIPDYQSVVGYMGLSFLRKIENQHGHFTLITYWDSIESIKEFARDDYEKAKYYPEDNDYLIEFEKHVQHFDVFADHVI
jgi:heme-degrading monooxygenase HmoA